MRVDAVQHREVLVEPILHTSLHRERPLRPVHVAVDEVAAEQFVELSPILTLTPDA